MKLCNFLKTKKIIKSITFIILLSFLIFLGIYYWHYKNTSELQEVSDTYQSLINTIEKNNSSEKVHNFIKKNNNIYGLLASLEMTKKYIDKNQLQDAEIELKKSFQIIKNVELKNILSIRLARVQLAQKKIDDAIKTLGEIHNEEWKNIKSHLLGYALLIKNDIQGARNIWIDSINHDNSNILKDIIQMQIDNIN